MRLRKDKKPSFAPRKQKLDLKSKLEWIIIIATLLDWLGISVKDIIQAIIKYILSLF